MRLPLKNVLCMKANRKGKIEAVAAYGLEDRSNPGWGVHMHLGRWGECEHRVVGSPTRERDASAFLRCVIFAYTHEVTVA